MNIDLMSAITELMTSVMKENFFNLFFSLMHFLHAAINYDKGVDLH